ncbi:MAG: hypothetical protein BEU01_00180 [Marine Group III euryarchaeote CG-Epi4]|uniref:SAM-dependent methyltransferase TRM5/TYW2-type domain-containing protein n=1 Tax=Marine Group III euryarchaeote CG-Epi4 TaxID=1888998 RepID=A0A1J5TYV6_9ARCH|nr:MAG: hypothetical protein BEU01_00180 [Marine Group III euryarchaeote CG-Epi4]
MISHLKVANKKAEEAKDFLKNKGYLNESYLPIKEDNFVLWPLNQDSVPFEGNIVIRKGSVHNKKSRDYRLNLDKEIRDIAPRSFDIFGDIAILRLPSDSEVYEKQIAKALLLSHKNIKTVCVDLGVHGEFRIRDLRVISGDTKFISVHKENGMKFEADISKVYFSPRLATERERLSSIVNKDENVLDAFAGVAPFSISIAMKGCIVTSLDSNPEAIKWALRNFNRNGVHKKHFSFFNSKFEDYNFGEQKFDRIILNNPTNCLPFLDKAMTLVVEMGMIHFYSICPKDGSFQLSKHLAEEFECIAKREVHAYSPSSSLFVFDIRRNLI